MSYFNDDDPFYRKELPGYLDDMGKVPPPWVFSPDAHPYSIQWRMGAGESYLMIFSTWFGSHYTSVEEKLDYFRNYPPPPRWLAWVADCVWDLEPLEEDFDYTPYFEQLQAAGFEGTGDYEADLDNERWT